MAAADELLEMRSHFFIGNYQLAINDADAITGGNPEVQARKKLLQYRCYICLGNANLVIDDVDDSAPPELQLVKLLALYTLDPTDESARSKITQALSSPCTSELASDFRAIVGGIYYLNEGDYDEALRSVVQSTWLEGYVPFSLFFHPLLLMFCH
tara:strand:- start:718 stop:1182 length:465 start_codon:yes stop_codon:yes gene_type:complete